MSENESQNESSDVLVSSSKTNTEAFGSSFRMSAFVTTNICSSAKVLFARIYIEPFKEDP